MATPRSTRLLLGCASLLSFAAHTLQAQIVCDVAFGSLVLARIKHRAPA